MSESTGGALTPMLAIFQARAYVERAPAQRLGRWIDVPWCHGHLCSIRNLAVTLDAAGDRR